MVTKRNMSKKISVVIPVYYNAGSLPTLFSRLASIEKNLIHKKCILELIFIDDGSTDESWSIIQNLNMVDNCILFGDDDNSSVEAIRNVKMIYPNDEIIFANGGDRTKENIPEMIFDYV